MTHAQPHESTAADLREDCWELLTQDALSREEQALLRALADENEADGVRLEAHLPLDASYCERMTDKLAAQIAEEKRRRKLRTTRFAATTALLAAAACLLLMLRPPAVQVPEYALAIRGQVADERGARASSGPLRLTPSSRLDIQLTPATRTGDDLVLSTFLERDGKVVPWSMPAEAASSGAFRIQTSARKLLNEQYGEWTAIFVIGPKPLSRLPLDASRGGGLAIKRARLSYYPTAEQSMP